MVAVFVRVKVAGDKGKVSEKNERFFDFLGLEGSTIEEKSKVFMDLKEKEGSQMMKKQFCYYAFCDEKAQYHGRVKVRHGNHQTDKRTATPKNRGSVNLIRMTFDIL